MKRLIIFLLVLICGITLSSCKTNKPKELELLSIEIEHAEGITVYKGDIYVPTGIKVFAIYDGDRKNVTSSAQFSRIDTEELGFKTVTVTYQDKESSYQVEVIRRTEEHTYRLMVKEQPTKQLYYIDEELDLEGLEIVMVADDTVETTIQSDLYSMRLSLNGVSKGKLDEVGTYQISFALTHQGITYTTYLFIEVINNPDVITRPSDVLLIDEAQSKLSYWTNEAFDPETLVIQIKDEQSSHTALVSSSLCSFTISFNGINVEEFKDEGTYLVKIEYSSLSCIVEINVRYRKVVQRLELDITDAKVNFRTGESFSSSGLIIKYYE
ncbi:MAG: bacterial Ig-like domain-containing protein, partial [Anaeroplasmataceae bacterium]|nr:bacterial Ig-like domain-containing protein [Anaeroplasmataceae bacterium]